MNQNTLAAKVEVTSDAEGLTSHSGAYLLTEVADRLGLTKALSKAMAPARSRRSVHDPGTVIRDLATSIADGGDCVSDLGMLAGQKPEGSFRQGCLKLHRPPGDRPDR